MNPILEIRDLEVTFRVGPMMRRQDIQAVAGVSFEVQARRDLCAGRGKWLRQDNSGPRGQRTAADLERLGPF